MRVIAGQFRGRNLVSVKGSNIRPAADRVKETIFNILQNRLSLEGALVLDLFAGTGSLGLETISRGAAHAVFVDATETSLRLLRANIGRLRCESLCSVIDLDAMRFIETTDKRFDLIFADPPYAFESTTTIPEIIFRRNLLEKKGILIIEHSKSTEIPESPRYQTDVRKQFGRTVVSFFSER